MALLQGSESGEWTRRYGGQCQQRGKKDEEQGDSATTERESPLVIAAPLIVPLIVSVRATVSCNVAV